MGLLINSFKFREVSNGAGAIFDLPSIKFFVINEEKDTAFIYYGSSGYPHHVKTNPKEVDQFITKFKKHADLILYTSKNNRICIYEDDGQITHELTQNKKDSGLLPNIYINYKFIDECYVYPKTNSIGIWIDDSDYTIQILHENMKDKMNLWSENI